MRRQQAGLINVHTQTQEFWGSGREEGVIMASQEKSYGPCWCASADKCPHPVASKYPVQEEELEKIIDKILKQFDRRSIKQYLKEQTASKGQSMVLKDGGKLKEVKTCSVVGQYEANLMLRA